MIDEDIALGLTVGLNGASALLLMTSTNPWELDDAMRSHGFAQGVCQAQDIEGLDVGLARQAGAWTLAGLSGKALYSRMVSEGRLGRKVGVGWYRYPGGGGRVIDPLVEDLLREEARFAGITRHELSEGMLVAQVITGVAMAALQVLAIAGKEAKSDIDDASTAHLGFPPVLGGVLSHVLKTGRAEIECRLKDTRPDDAQWRQVAKGLNLLFA